jgi:hypothetical protein
LRRCKKWKGGGVRSALPFVGIAALMIAGLIVLMAALTWDPLVKSARQRDRPQTRVRRHKLQRIKGRAQHALSAARKALQESNVTLRTLRAEWGPRLRSQARRTRRGLSLESPRVQLVLSAAISVIAAWLLISLVG